MKRSQNMYACRVESLNDILPGTLVFSKTGCIDKICSKVLTQNIIILFCNRQQDEIPETSTEPTPKQHETSQQEPATATPSSQLPADFSTYCCLLLAIES